MLIGLTLKQACIIFLFSNVYIKEKRTYNYQEEIKTKILKILKLN